MEPARPAVLNRASRAPRGFSIVEMMVVLAIITIITTIALIGQSQFDRSFILTDTAYTVAYSIRTAQALGLSSQKFGSATNTGYGVQFSAADSYTSFADVSPASPGSSQSGICPGHAAAAGTVEARPGNCVYDSSSERVQTYSFRRGYRIARFCGTSAGGSVYCSGSEIDSLNILFQRPSTESVITGVRGSVLYQFASATIRIASPDGQASKCIKVSKVGQVAVADGSTCT
jgi:prepilin-type N-terminal cleavage/methylation domain-containing protein